jgi:hypothetical protein
MFAVETSAASELPLSAVHVIRTLPPSCTCKSNSAVFSSFSCSRLSRSVLTVDVIYLYYYLHSRPDLRAGEQPLFGWRTSAAGAEKQRLEPAAARRSTLAAARILARERGRRQEQAKL